jgi:UDP-hydrolysing UDP-N-acetyl-D-glucosamine 2-epimerase
MKQKEICVYTCNRSEYSRLKSVMKAIDAHPGLALKIIVGGSQLLERYGMTVADIERDGFVINEKIQNVVEGSTPEAMAKSTGLAIIELTTCFSRLQPDVLLVVGDRYDMLPAVVAASYLNIPIAHIQGGEKTGSIDESIRHVVTKFAHLHFPATERSKDLIIKMDEKPNRVFVTGCPSIDTILKIAPMDRQTLFENPPIPSKLGVKSPSAYQDYILLIQHPNTTEYDECYDQMLATLAAIHKIRLQTLLIYPNLDAGSDRMVAAIRRFMLKNECDYLFCFKHVPMNTFINLLRHASCIVGNSSSGIRESCYFGIPCVNIGTRQNNREHGSNVINTSHDSEEIYQAIKKQLTIKKYPVEHVYGDGHASTLIADILYRSDIKVQK